ncbi:MAG: hypothetical protein NVSMB23_22890 [Myxococcales bacterium]
MPAIHLAPPAYSPAVLLVDDEKVVLDVMTRMLQAAGFSLVVAQTGEQALEHLASREFACALIDKNLQGIDGLEVIRHVRMRQPRCACVLMTAYASTGSAVEALRLGVVDYLEKPSPELDVIGERIQGAIRAQAVRDQQGALVKRASDLDGGTQRGEPVRPRLEALPGRLAAQIDGPEAASASAAVRDERDQRLLRGAEALVRKLTGLREQTGPAARPDLDKLLQDAVAHLALLRAGG